jgi:chemotaxis protein CheD
LRVLAVVLGVFCPRRVAFFPASGMVRVRHLKPLEATRIAESERRYLSDIAKPKDTGGDVELFE